MENTEPNNETPISVRLFEYMQDEITRSIYDSRCRVAAIDILIEVIEAGIVDLPRPDRCEALVSDWGSALAGQARELLEVRERFDEMVANLKALPKAKTDSAAGALCNRLFDTLFSALDESVPLHRWDNALATFNQQINSPGIEYPLPCEHDDHPLAFVYLDRQKLTEFAQTIHDNAEAIDRLAQCVRRRLDGKNYSAMVKDFASWAGVAK